MAILRVKLNGDEVTSITLEAGKEYVAGRAPDAQIHLDTQKGISRHHLKFYERDGVWICEALSKFLLLQKGSESMQVLELTEAMAFTVPPYEFVFEPDAKAEEKSSAEAAKSENLPAFFQPRLNAPASAGGSSGNPDHTPARVNNEATVAGQAHLVPYFRISYPNTADDEVLKLEGDLWVAGRDSNCEIPIDSPHISRRHFELARTNEGFFITDLGSSNGTKVNGQKVPPHEPARVESGDEIRVMNIEMTFEIRDTQFANRVDRLPVPAFDPMLGVPAPHYGGGGLPALDAPTQYNGARDDSEEHVKGWRGEWKKLKKNKVRLALVVMVPVVLILALSPGKPDKPKPNPRDPASSATFETLSKEQKLVVKDSFNLARNLYVQGKYALCLTELAKLHELIPQYENSKELQSFCEQGLELVRREEERQRQQREREEVEQRISGYVEQCKTQLGAAATVDETRKCLAPAIELAPEHPLVVELIHSAQMHEEEKQFLAKQKKEEESKAAKGAAQFHRAMDTYKGGQLAKAIKQLEKFMAANWPHTDGMKSEAKRNIASIKKELDTKVDALLAQCKDLGGKQKYKEAYYACAKAVEENPGAGDAKDYMDKMHDALRRDMKVIYEDSVLEESLGNVDSAKEKWKKIIADDLPQDEYTRKAKSKLSKYGGSL
jgi:pSer/pThr/pTyr-binding forkhead associated (FHA) protein/TolA-binding protein